MPQAAGQGRSKTKRWAGLRAAPWARGGGRPGIRVGLRVPQVPPGPAHGACLVLAHGWGWGGSWSLGMERPPSSSVHPPGWGPSPCARRGHRQGPASRAAGGCGGSGRWGSGAEQLLRERILEAGGRGLLVPVASCPVLRWGGRAQAAASRVPQAQPAPGLRSCAGASRGEGKSGAATCSCLGPSPVPWHPAPPGWQAPEVGWRRGLPSSLHAASREAEQTDVGASAGSA